MKKYLMMAFVSLFAVAALSSCDKDKDENNDDGGTDGMVITANFGSSYDGKIDTVKVLVFKDGDSYETGYYEVATSPYTNGGFTLNLPSTVNSSYLNEFEYEIQDMPNITVSASNVKIKKTYMYIVAYKSGRETGVFYHGTSDWEGVLVYASADLSVTGYEDEENGRISYDMH